MPHNNNFEKAIRSKNSKTRENGVFNEIKLLMDPLDAFLSEGDCDPYVYMKGESKWLKRLKSVLRNSLGCPYGDIRKWLTQFFCELTEYYGIIIAAEYPEQSLLLSTVSIDSHKNLFLDLYRREGRISHLYRVMAWHPKFTQHFIESFSSIMEKDGTLELPVRHYIAIMASARYGCEYLVKMAKRNFLFAGGNPSWICGVEYAPPKLQSLCKLNKILAHQPWRSAKVHMRDLMDLSGNSDFSHWTNSEILHAILIMVTFHSLAGFVFGSYITPEIDDQEVFSKDHKRKILKKVFEVNVSTDCSSQDRLVQILHDEEHNSNKITESSKGGNNQDTTKCNENVEFNKKWDDMAKTTTDEVPTFVSNEVKKEQQHFLTLSFSDMKIYKAANNTEDQELQYQEPEADAIRDLHFWNWNENGYIIVKNYCPEMAEPLHHEFRFIRGMTDRTVSDKRDVNTSYFRDSIWYFTQRLFGLCRRDWDKERITHIMDDTVRKFVVKLVTKPDQITFEDQYWKGYKFRDDEKCLIMLLAMEARRQAALMHALKAFIDYINISTPRHVEIYQ